MLITTTNVIEWRPVREYCGLISAEVIVGANFIKDIFAALSDFFGGRSSAYERALIKGKNEAMQELIAKAQNLGGWCNHRYWYGFWSGRKGIYVYD